MSTVFYTFLMFEKHRSEFLIEDDIVGFLGTFLFISPFQLFRSPFFKGNCSIALPILAILAFLAFLANFILINFLAFSRAVSSLVWAIKSLRTSTEAFLLTAKSSGVHPELSFLVLLWRLLFFFRQHPLYADAGFLLFVFSKNSLHNLKFDFLAAWCRGVNFHSLLGF